MSRSISVIAVLPFAASLISVACGDPSPPPAAEPTLAAAATATATPSPPTSTPTPASPTSTPTREPTATSVPPTSTPAPTPEPPSAREVLEATTAAMGAVKSGRAEAEVTMKAEIGGVTQEMAASIAGDFQHPDRSQFTMDFSLGGLSVELEGIVIGGRSYMKNPVTGTWEANPESPAPFGNLLAFGAFNTDFAPEVASGFSLVGEEELDGEPVYHLRGPVSGEVLADLLDDPSVGGGEGEVQYWVGVEDFLVRKTAIELEVSDEDLLTGERATMRAAIVATLSDYGKLVDIQAPEVQSGGPWPDTDDHGDYLEIATPTPATGR